MTIRQWLSRRVRWTYTAIGTAGLYLWLDRPVPGQIPVAFLVAFGTAMVLSVASHLFLFRCPRCRCNLGALLAGGMRQFRGVDPRLVCCPYCTLSLNERMPEPEPAAEYDRYQTTTRDGLIVSRAVESEAFRRVSNRRVSRVAIAASWAVPSSSRVASIAALSAGESGNDRSARAAFLTNFHTRSVRSRWGECGGR